MKCNLCGYESEIDFAHACHKAQACITVGDLLDLQRRLSESEQREREAVAVVAALPDNAAGIRAFVGSNFCSIEYGQPDEAPSDDDVYVVSAHDLLSAFLSLAELAPQALSSLRQQIRSDAFDEARKACLSVEQSHAELPCDQPYRTGWEHGTIDCHAAIRRLAEQGEGKEGED